MKQQSKSQYRVVWSPSAELIAIVEAESEKQAIRKATKGTIYRRYLGEVYAQRVDKYEQNFPS